MKIVFIVLLISLGSAHGQTEWPSYNPPFKEYPLQALWTDSFRLDSAVISKDTTKKPLITVPNNLSTIDKAVAAYVSFNTKAWGKSLYKSDYFAKMDYPSANVLEVMNSDDHKKNGYYRHYLTLHLSFDTSEVAACFVETYYNQAQPKVYYLLMFERKENGWFLLGGNPYQYVKSLSEIKFHYIINLLQGIEMKPNEPNVTAYNKLFSKVYKNNSIDLSLLTTEMIPNIFDNDSIKNYKMQYADLLATPNYAINWNLISQNKMKVSTLNASKKLFPSYFENMKNENDKHFIFDEKKLDFTTEESALASLYSTQSKATFDLYSINCTYNSYWPTRVRQLDTLQSYIHITRKFTFSFNGTYYSIVGYNLIINGKGVANLYARFIRKLDSKTVSFLYYKDETKGNYKLDEITWLIACMDNKFLRRLCGIDPVNDPEDLVLIKKLQTDSMIDFYKIINVWYLANNPLRKYIVKPD